MKIIVPIKQVPETSNVKMDPQTGTMIRSGLQAIINPLDLYAIELALRIKEKLGGFVTTISMGPPAAEKAIREAIAMGCDAGVLLSNRAFSGADTWATAYVLSQAINKLGSTDLVICGERATDGDTGQVGPAIASFLNLPLATYVCNLPEITSSGLIVNRLVEGGTEVLKIPLPTVVTVVKEIALPRLPTLNGIRKARLTEIPIWGPEDIQANPEWIGLKGSPTRVVKIQHAHIARKGKIVFVKDQSDAKEIARQLLSFLLDRNLLNHNERNP